MSRRLRPMTAADLDRIPAPCRRCLVWEDSLLDRPAWARRRDPIDSKRELAEAVTRRWGHCGVTAGDGQDLLGYAMLAPARGVPRRSGADSWSGHPYAAVLLGVFVAEPHRGQGLGRQLVQSAAGLMVRRDIRVLEAVGSYREDGCVCPVGFLQRVGFSVVRQHPVTPRLRMDLQSTVRWRPDLGAAWHRLAGLIPQPSAGPEPAHRQGSAVAVRQDDVVAVSGSS